MSYEKEIQSCIMQMMELIFKMNKIPLTAQLNDADAHQIRELKSFLEMLCRDCDRILSKDFK